MFYLFTMFIHNFGVIPFVQIKAPNQQKRRSYNLSKCFPKLIIPSL